MKNETIGINDHKLAAIPTADQAFEQSQEAFLKQKEQAKAICLAGLYHLLLDRIKIAINKGESKVNIYSDMSSDIQSIKNIINDREKAELLSEFIQNIKNKGYTVHSPKSAKSFFEKPWDQIEPCPITVDWHVPQDSK